MREPWNFCFLMRGACGSARDQHLGAHDNIKKVARWINTPSESLEKWQSHCSEEINEIDFSQGISKSRNWKFAHIWSKIVTFAENVNLLLPGEPAGSGGMLPLGSFLEPFGAQ